MVLLKPFADDSCWAPVKAAGSSEVTKALAEVESWTLAVIVVIRSLKLVTFPKRSRTPGKCDSRVLCRPFQVLSQEPSSRVSPSARVGEGDLFRHDSNSTASLAPWSAQRVRSFSLPQVSLCLWTSPLSPPGPGGGAPGEWKQRIAEFQLLPPEG